MYSSNSIAERLITVYSIKKLQRKQLEYVTKDHIASNTYNILNKSIF